MSPPSSASQHDGELAGPGEAGVQDGGEMVSFPPILPTWPISVADGQGLMGIPYRSATTCVARTQCSVLRRLSTMGGGRRYDV